MKKTTIIYFILFAITLTLLTIFIAGNNLRTKPYRELEDNVVLAMKKYYGQDTNLTKLPKNKQEVKITIKELKEFGLNIDTKIKEDNCDGYGIVTGQEVSHNYHAYIKCDKYTTKNYENKK